MQQYNLLLHADHISQRDRVSRDVSARIVAAGDDRRGDESHAPVLGLELHGVHVGPDGHHGLAREAATNLGDPEVKRQAAAKDTTR